MEIMAAILYGEPAALDAPAAVAAAVARCLRKAPAERFQTMKKSAPRWKQRWQNPPTTRLRSPCFPSPT
jgi:hypothetical protein